MAIEIQSDIYGKSFHKLWEREPVPTAKVICVDAQRCCALGNDGTTGFAIALVETSRLLLLAQIKMAGGVYPMGITYYWLGNTGALVVLEIYGF